MSERDIHVRRLQASWQDNAEAWTMAVRGGGIESRRLATDRAILDAVLALRPRRVLDLGCGEGWLVRALAAQGVAAVGVDGSAPLIEVARAAGGEFLHLSYENIATNPSLVGGFDLAVANFALLEERVEPLLAALRAITAERLRLIIQTPHPLVITPPYRNGWRTEDFRGFGTGVWTPMPWYFRTLGSWITVLKESGFRLCALDEPRHPETEQPLSLLMKAQAIG